MLGRLSGGGQVRRCIPEGRGEGAPGSPALDRRFLFHRNALPWTPPPSAASWRNPCAAVPLLDAHTHLDATHLRARGLHDILLYHMVISDLVSAGCPDRDGLPRSPTDEEARARIERALPYPSGHLQHELLLGPAHHPSGSVRLAAAGDRGQLAELDAPDPRARPGGGRARRNPGGRRASLAAAPSCGAVTTGARTPCCSIPWSGHSSPGRSGGNTIRRCTSWRRRGRRDAPGAPRR